MDSIEKVEIDGCAAASENDFSAEELDRELVRLHPELRARALFLTQGSASADDLVQDVIERALRGRHRFQRGMNLKGWLNAVMRNRFIDAYREQSNRLSRDLQSETSPSAEPRGPLDLVTMDDVLEALARLKPSDREIFTLASLEHLSYREISTRLKIPVNTAGTRLLRARAKLQRMLTQVYEIRRRTTPNISSR